MNNFLKNLYCDFVVLVKVPNLSLIAKFKLLIDKYIWLLQVVLKSQNPKYFFNKYTSNSSYGLLDLTVMLKDFDKYYCVKGLSAPIIFDVGANVGNFSLASSYYYKDAYIYAFEPIMETFNKLSSNLESLTNIEKYNMGLGNKVETTNMYVSKNEYERSSFYKENIIDTENATLQEVKIGTVDVFVSENDIKSIDILKIDVEGHELEVLEGALKSLSITNFIIIEFHLSKNTHKFIKSLDVLFENGFGIYKLGKTWRNPDTNTLKVGEFIFKKE